MEKLKIITISGKAGSGKSYLANHLKQYLEVNYGMRGYIINFADPLKMVCEKIYGWDGTKGETGRTILQRIGTDVVQQSNKLCWVNCVANIIQGLRSEFDFVIIGDARFRHELEGISEEFCYDSITNVVIIDNGHPNNLSEEQRNHPSETDLDKWTFHYEFDNSSHSIYTFFRQLSDLTHEIINPFDL